MGADYPLRSAPNPTSSAERAILTDDELVEIVRLIGTRFIERRDVKAVMDEPPTGYQRGNPVHWQPVQLKDRETQEVTRYPFTMQDFKDHLEGRRTFGHYMVNPEGNTCKLFAFDLDLRDNKPPKPENDDPGFQGWYFPQGGSELEPCDPRPDFLVEGHPAHQFLSSQLRGLAMALASTVVDLLGIEVAVATSGGKGLHVYGFTGSTEARFAREAALAVLREAKFEPYRGDNFFLPPGAVKNVSIEVFPKQDTLDGKDLGNLMKLPLGVHRTTGRRSYFIDMDADPFWDFVSMDPIKALTGPHPWEA